MNKAPAFQFYVGDYLQDTRCLSLAAKGAWTDCLCAMWRSQIRGEITYPLIGYARLFGCTVEQAKAVIDELVEMQICNSVTQSDGKVTLTNRRMQREAKERESANNRQSRYRERQKKGGDGQGDGESNANVTPPSSSLSSSSSSKLSVNGGGSRAGAREKPPPATHSPPMHPDESQPDYLLRKQLEFPHLDVQKVFADFSAKCRSGDYPRLKLARPQFDKWLSTEHPPMEAAENSADDGVYRNPLTGKAVGE